jgi:secretion/DNA translocation related TadE-like protein
MSRRPGGAGEGIGLRAEAGLRGDMGLGGDLGLRTGVGLRGDRGMATVLACFCVMALVAFAALAFQLGTAAVAREQAETAADLGALAGAAVVLNGPDSACRAAATVVGLNGGAVSECTVDGADVLISVTVDAAFGPMTRHAQARARAGPTARQSP